MKSKAEFIEAYKCVLSGYVLQALVVNESPHDFAAKGRFVNLQIQRGEALLGQMYDYINGLTPAPLEVGSVDEMTDALIAKIKGTHPEVRSAALAKLRAAFNPPAKETNGVHKP